MPRAALLATTLALMAIVPGPIRAEDPPASPIRDQYERMRAKATSAESLWKLALWCESHDLKAEAREQLAEVVRLDPKRDAAWKRLGFKKVDGQWLDPAGVVPAAEAKKSIREWGEKLQAIHKNVHKGKKQAEARAALAAIVDPLAVPAIFREFGRSAKDQRIAVDVLGQIPGASSSKALAYLAVFGASPEVQAIASGFLRPRDPRDYARPLIELISDPLKYRFQPVGGPESPGILFVEGETYNVRRLYQAPAPDAQFRPGDSLIIDPDGTERILRPDAGPSVLETGAKVKTGQSFTMKDAQQALYQSVIAASDQLRRDVEAMETLNADRLAFRERVVAVLKDATGKNPGIDRKSWADWFATLDPSSRKPEKRRKPGDVKPTIDELAPLATDTTRFGSTVLLGSAEAMASGKGGTTYAPT